MALDRQSKMKSAVASKERKHPSERGVLGGDTGRALRPPCQCLSCHPRPEEGLRAPGGGTVQRGLPCNPSRAADFLPSKSGQTDATI